MRPPAQVLSGLLDTLGMVMTTEVNAANWDEHNAEVAKVRDQITQAKEDLTAEDVRMATMCAELEAQW